MKKILFIMLFGIFALYAEKIQILGTPNFRENPNDKAKVLPVITEVLETYGDWVEVEITEGKYIGKKGYLGVVGVDVATGKVLEAGARLRSLPTVSENIIGNVKGGTHFKVTKIIITWYKTAFGWIYKDNAKIIQ